MDRDLKYELLFLSLIWFYALIFVFAFFFSEMARTVFHLDGITRETPIGPRHDTLETTLVVLAAVLVTLRRFLSKYTIGIVYICFAAIGLYGFYKVSVPFGSAFGAFCLALSRNYQVDNRLNKN